jgi:diacylglycerol kinase
MKPGHTRSWRPSALWTSLVYAGRGVRVMMWDEPNGRIHLAATVLVLVAGAAFHLSRIEWCWIVAASAAVWAAEGFNTAIEALTDLASPAIHPLAARAKDVAAGAVLVTAIAAAVIGLLILGPHAYVWWAFLTFEPL